MLLGLVGEMAARDDVARCLSLLDGFVQEPVAKAWLKVERAEPSLKVCCPDLLEPADAMWIKARGGFVVWCGHDGLGRTGLLAEWPFDWVLNWSDHPDLLVRRVSTMVQALAWRSV